MRTIFYYWIVARNVVMTFFWSLIYTVYLHLHPAVEIKGGIKVCGKMVWEIDPFSTVIVGRNVRINSGWQKNALGGDKKCIIATHRGAVLKIGDNVGISNSTVICGERMLIGNDTFIGGGCVIVDTDFHSVVWKQRSKKPDTSVVKRPVTIGEASFVGGYTTILKGTTIGAEAVIGFGSMVCGKTIGNREIWVGNPARYLIKL